MPLYEYRCQSCGDFEQWRSLAEVSTPMVCPTCDQVAQKIFSAPNLNLNSGNLRLKRGEIKEPKLVQKDLEPKQSRYKQSNCGRPWMISH